MSDRDKDFHEDLKVVPETFCCDSCGNIEENQKEPEEDCAHCGFNRWHPAIRS